MKFFLEQSDRIGVAEYLIPADSNAERICELLEVEKIRLGSKEERTLQFFEFDLGVTVEVYERRAM